MLFINIIKAVVVRVFLLTHSLIAIWRVVILTNNSMFWWLGIGDVVLIGEAIITLVANKGMEYKWYICFHIGIGDVVLIGEAIITLVANKGMEYKWFCPCFLIYLGSTVPAIWLLELDRREKYISKANVNETITPSYLAKNTTQMTDETLATFYGIQVNIPLEPETLVVTIEQLLLYFMIIGRWILPRGTISRNELSQLLFVFIGMASDITELFTLFDEQKVRENLYLTFAILIIWTVSLLQFCFVLTATSNPKRQRVALKDKKKRRLSSCCGTEIWSILVSMFMQDIPFLVVRTYTIAALDLINYSIIFFTAKNTLVILLLFYRIVVLCLHKDDVVKDEDTEIGLSQNKPGRRDPKTVPALYHISNDVHKRHNKDSKPNFANTIGSL